MLKIKIPDFCVPEIEYTCSVVFTEWFDIDYEIMIAEQSVILISSGNNKLQLNVDFFAKASNNWLMPETLPSLPLKNYNLSELRIILRNDIHICESELPVLYGIPEIAVTENRIDCSIDILGVIFL